MNRNLDGVYFRVKRDDQWQNICFTDLTEEETEEILKDRSNEWMRSMIKSFCEVFKNVQSYLFESELEQAATDMIVYGSCTTLKDELLAIKHNILCMANIADIVKKEIEGEEE